MRVSACGHRRQRVFFAFRFVISFMIARCSVRSSAIAMAKLKSNTVWMLPSMIASPYARVGILVRELFVNLFYPIWLPFMWLLMPCFSHAGNFEMFIANRVLHTWAQRSNCIGFHKYNTVSRCLLVLFNVLVWTNNNDKDFDMRIEVIFANMLYLVWSLTVSIKWATYPHSLLHVMEHEIVPVSRIIDQQVHDNFYRPCIHPPSQHLHTAYQWPLAPQLLVYHKRAAPFLF